MSLAETRREWLENRRRGIGGSDVAGILGLSKWSTPATIWAEKTGRAELQTESPLALMIGNALEPLIREKYEEQTGTRTRQSHKMQVSKSHPFLVANLDGTAPGKVVEFKTSRLPEDWGEPGTDQIPTEYLVQVQHYMAVARRPVADVAVLFVNRTWPELAIFTVEADADIQNDMAIRCAEFWELVQNDIPPEPITVADARDRWRNHTDSQVVATPDIVSAVEELAAIKQRAKSDEGRAADLEFKICRFMESHATLVGVDGKQLATWRTAKDSVRIDSKAIRERFPEAAKECEQVTPGARRFLLKGGR